MAYTESKLKSASASRSSPIHLPSSRLSTNKHPKDMALSEFLKDSEYSAWLRSHYGTGTSSRTTPAPFSLKPGIWKFDDTFNTPYGHTIDQLVAIPVDEIIPGEVTSQAKLPDVDRYSKWTTQAPPINVIHTSRGTYQVANGHRRWLAAKARGDKTILAWVSWNMPSPTGSVYGGTSIRQELPLTYEYASNWEPGWYPAMEGQWW